MFICCLLSGIFNNHKEDQSLIYEHFIVPPQITPFDFGEDEINSDDVVSVTCTVNRGDFPVEIYWTLSNITVDKISGITVTRTSKKISQLSIDSVQADHSGEYTCHAKNSAGIAIHSTMLHVNGILILCLFFQFKFL